MMVEPSMKKKQAHIDKKEDQTKKIILEIIKKQNPETTNQLFELVQEKITLAPEEITQLLIQLENENKLNFKQKTPLLPSKFQAYAFSKKATWYWITIAFSLFSVLTVFAIPDGEYPVIYFRYGFGIVFLVFLPGYALMKTLFPSNLPIPTGSENMDAVESAVLGIGMSLILVMLVGLILSYTIWGISLTPVTFSLLGVTIIFATSALLREYQAKAVAIKMSS